MEFDYAFVLWFSSQYKAIRIANIVIGERHEPNVPKGSGLLSRQVGHLRKRGVQLGSSGGRPRALRATQDE
jgi:hypothetical protein